MESYLIFALLGGVGDDSDVEIRYLCQDIYPELVKLGLLEEIQVKSWEVQPYKITELGKDYISRLENLKVNPEKWFVDKDGEIWKVPPGSDIPSKLSQKDE